MKTLWPGLLSLLPLVACSDEVVIRGQVVDENHDPWNGSSHITVVTYEVWTGEVANDAGQVHELDIEASEFEMRVPPGHWAILAAQGTCNSAPATELTAQAGDETEVELLMRCNE